MLGRAPRARRDLRGRLARRHAEVQLGLVKRDWQLLGGGNKGEGQLSLSRYMIL